MSAALSRFIPRLVGPRPERDIKTGHIKYSRLRVGRTARFKLRRCENIVRATLTLEHEDGKQVYAGEMPVRGHISFVPASTSPLHLKLTLYTAGGNSFDYEWVRYPHGRRVHVAMSIPKRVFIGDDMTIAFNSNKRITSIVVEINDELPRVCRPNDVIVLRPEKLGTVAVRFKAKSPHGDITEAETVKVEAREPKITMNAVVQTAAPGKEAIFSWSAVHSLELWLEGRGERYLVQSDQAVVVPVGSEEETLRLVAIGIGGTVTQEFRVIPWLLGDVA
jgi:hypothetical protein